MKLQSIILALAFASKAEANSSENPCLAACTGSGSSKECTFIVSRDQFASELGYFKFAGDGGDCGGTNPVLGIEKGVTYHFIQEDLSNYYHAMGFAYGNDGALDNKDELEPTIRGPDSTSNCIADATCPAPMYIKNDTYVGVYSNNAAIAPLTTNEDDFGLDAYEPEFFYPVLDWTGAGVYRIALFIPDDYDYIGDFFYFCHIHEFMTGRMKFVDSSGDPINVDGSGDPIDEPEIPYPYESLSAYDASCGTSGLDDFQLPNAQCPDKFVCDRPDGAVGKFAQCIDSMNCAMFAGMTTTVNENNALALFNHQMIPHHQNAVNMCKSLLNSGEADCADIEDEDDPKCVINVICQEIINTQNAQIQTMRGVLDALAEEDPNIFQTSDCAVRIRSSLKCPRCIKKAKQFKKKSFSNCVSDCEADPKFIKAGCGEACCEKICEAKTAFKGCRKVGFCGNGKLDG